MAKLESTSRTDGRHGGRRVCAIGLASALSSFTGCYFEPIVYRCAVNADCDREPDGKCEDSRYCSYPSDKCDDSLGRVYSDNASPDLRGDCLATTTLAADATSDETTLASGTSGSSESTGDGSLESSTTMGVSTDMGEVSSESAGGSSTGEASEVTGTGGDASTGVATGETGSTGAGEGSSTGTTGA